MIRNSARGACAKIANCVIPRRWARRHFTTLDVRRHIRGLYGSRGLVVLERPLFLGPIDLPQVVDAGVLLSGLTGFDEVRDGDRGEEADNRNHDHDFHQREAGLTILLDTHNCYYVYCCCLHGVNPAAGGYYDCMYGSLITCDQPQFPV